MSSYAFVEIDTAIDDDTYTAMTLSDELLCVATEKGRINVYDKKTFRKFHWLAHDNAIFDTKWRIDYPGQLVTTSGDLSIRLWDLNKYSTGPLSQHDNSHLSSVKSLSFCDSNLLATGARDGNIKLWDLRGSIAPICMIAQAHKLKPVGAKRTRKGQINRSNPLASVTCVLFKPNSFSLYSCASGHPNIHLWDIRMPTRATEHLTPARLGQGYSSLTLDPSGRLFASCSNNNIYGFDPQGNLIAKLSHNRYSCPSNNMSKIRTLDGQWLIAGSSQNCILIWALDSLTTLFPNDPPRPRIILKDLDEVIGLEADSSTYDLFSTGPDSVHRWRIEKFCLSK